MNLAPTVADEEPEAVKPLPTTRFRARWVTHAESGFLVTPRTCTRQDPTSIAKSTYRVRSQAVSTVKKPSARILWACDLRNSLHVGPSRRGAGPSPLARRSVRIFVAETLTPELGKLAPDPWAPPPWILPSHPQDELPDLSRDRWPPAGRDPFVGPLPSHQLPMPPKEVWGLTTNEDHRARGGALPIAAMNSRSRRRRRGRPTWRLRTISW